MPKTYEAVGRKIEDMPQANAYESTTGRDVLGEPFATTTKGESSVAVNPITVNKSSEFAKAINRIILFDLELSDLEFWFVCEHRYLKIGTDYASGQSFAYRQKASIVPGSYASGNQSLDMEATIQWIGEKTYGTYDAQMASDNFLEGSGIPDVAQMHYKDGDASRSEFRIYFEIDTTVGG